VAKTQFTVVHQQPGDHRIGATAHRHRQRESWQHPALRTAVMLYLLNNKGQAPTAENDYNTVVPTLPRGCRRRSVRS
jgi:hypothetical protein